MKKMLTTLAALLWAMAALSPLAAQNRYALVIGNNAYRGGSGAPALSNPVNDATDVAAALRELGYAVELKTDLGVKAMDDAIDAFFARLRTSEASEGFFWFAGHGLSLNGKQRLIAVDADISTDTRIERGSYEVDRLVERFRNTRNRSNLIVIDACRNVAEPGERTTASRGLSVVSAGVIGEQGNKIIYSTLPGKTASDGAAGKRNSPFAEAFLANMKKPDTFDNIFISIANDTRRLTGGKQEPYPLGYFSVPNYSLNSAAVAARPAVSAQSAQSAISGMAETGGVRVSSAADGAIWIDGKDTGVNIKAGGNVTVQNVSTGATKVSLKTADGWVFTVETRVEAGKAAAFSFSDRQQDFETKADGAGITIVKYKGQGTSVVIPASINGKSVTAIVRSAFRDCESLTSVTIPASIASVGERAFGSCASLKTISVHSANQWYKAIDGVLFTKDGKTLHTYPAGGKTAYSIPLSVTAIGASAFWVCTGLTSVTIPDSVTTIGESAFLGCTSLTSVTIPDSVTSVGESAFWGCGKLKPKVRADIEKRFGKEAF